MVPEMNEFGLCIGPEDYFAAPAIKCLDLYDMGRQIANGFDEN
jgi:hypothetical protein